MVTLKRMFFFYLFCLPALNDFLKAVFIASLHVIERTMAWPLHTCVSVF